MSEMVIDASQIYKGIMGGAKNIILNTEKLNESNGFPVPDRDTGSNLSYLMYYILKNTTKSQDFNEFIESVTDAAILGARGNSGSIFSQFFRGFGIKKSSTNKIHISELSDFFKNGYEYAYKSIKNPMEGTILTAMRSFAESLDQNIKENDLVNIFEKSYQILEDTVEKTKYMLKEHTRSKYEDAGALAFLYFVKGFIDQAILNKEIDISEMGIEEKTFYEDLKVDHEMDMGIKNRFCTEVLIRRDSSNDRESLVKLLESIGDSLVINDNEKFMRIHVHTNRPDEVSKLMDKYGQILEVKSDDMKMQKSLSMEHKKEIALVIDTIADIPFDRQNDFVYQLPINLMADNVSYQDKRTVYKELFDNKKVTSSQLNTKQVRKFIEPIINSYEHVIVLTVSSKMSGLYDRFDELKAEFKDKMTLIDTKLNSVAEGLIVEKAMELIRNKKELAIIKNEIEKYIENTKIYVSIPNLNAMIRSGRLNNKIGFVLKKSGFLPLVTINKHGEGKIEGVAFTKKKNEKMFYNVARKNKDKIKFYAISHSYDEKRANEAAKKFEEIIGFPPLYIEQVSGTVANFSGEGSLAIGFTLK